MRLDYFKLGDHENLPFNYGMQALMYCADHTGFDTSEILQNFDKLTSVQFMRLLYGGMVCGYEEVTRANPPISFNTFAELCLFNPDDRKKIVAKMEADLAELFRKISADSNLQKLEGEGEGKGRQTEAPVESKATPPPPPPSPKMEPDPEPEIIFEQTQPGDISDS